MYVWQFFTGLLNWNPQILLQQPFVTTRKKQNKKKHKITANIPTSFNLYYVSSIKYLLVKK